MKKMRWLCYVLLVAMIGMLWPVRASAVIAEGSYYYTDKVEWTIFNDGTLVVSTRGSFDTNLYPWKAYASSVKRIVLGDEVTRIPGSAFNDMENVEAVSLGPALEIIGDSAFYYCPSLRSVQLPASVKHIEAGAFCECPNLKELYIPQDGNLEYIGENAFAKTSITQLVTPPSLREIGAFAFEDCYELQQVWLSDGIEIVGSKAFRNCTALKSVYIPETVTELVNAFGGCNALEHLEIYGENVVDSFADVTSLKSVVIGGKVWRVPYGMFRGCTGLTSVVLDASLKEISGSAFAGCTNLTSIRLPETLESIQGSAFEGCGITSVTIPDGVTQIPMSTFSGCDALVTVDLGKGVTEISNFAFANCTALEMADLGNVEVIGSEAFSGCASLRSLIWSAKLREIQNYAFSGCASLEQVELAQPVNMVDNAAFSNCTALKKIVFCGKAPGVGDMNDIFKNVTATVYYPEGNSTWTSDVMQDYGGSITWEPICQEHISEKVDGVTANCVRGGCTEGTRCSVCAITLNAADALPALEHEMVTEQVTQPTCTQHGYRLQVCKQCGVTSRIVKQRCTGHHFGQWEVLQLATAEAAGAWQRICEDCDAIQLQPVMVCRSESSDSKPTEPKPTEPKPTETEPVETEPVETEPVETEPVETEPVETEPVVTEPVETEPVETEPVETEPVVTEPVETQPVETESLETEPVDTAQDGGFPVTAIVLGALALLGVGGGAVAVWYFLKKRNDVA